MFVYSFCFIKTSCASCLYLGIIIFTSWSQVPMYHTAPPSWNIPVPEKYITKSVPRANAYNAQMLTEKNRSVRTYLIAIVYIDMILLCCFFFFFLKKNASSSKRPIIQTVVSGNSRDYCYSSYAAALNYFNSLYLYSAFTQQTIVTQFPGLGIAVINKR